ncbi:metallochaperone AztD [Paracoccus laeviglucosivorans]|uniref:Zinc transport system substrate-binding protein n=1 Tax=Paracoccus laeviglucosivorans TaxID=1197861 RepID=A0A521FRI1_9RHOB|nr:metallochaperone AztD [Paracoccus laeviglucosivorans]SMO98837.1 hypothetical protein SAMN06265221_1378 [Paracoccus laeviglucosivorans]
MLKYFGGASVLALCLASASFAHDTHNHDHEHAEKHDHDHGDVTLYRIFVGDHEAGKVTAFDLTEPDHRWSFDTTGQVKLYPVAGGAAVAAVQSDNDQVDFITSGISFRDHGDHADIEIADPAAAEKSLQGPRPFHVVSHGGKVSINYDKGGYAELLDEHELSHGHVETTRFDQARAHHGFVTPMGEYTLSTVASDAQVTGDESVPRLGLQAFDADGKAQGDLAACTAIHGEAFSGAYLAAGCKEGVLTATPEENGVAFKLLPYPADFPKDVTTGTILGSKSVQMFLGNHGADGLVVIDPVDEPQMRRISLPFRRVDFALDPAKAADAYVLTEDGQLHRIDMLDGKIEASAKITAPYSMDGHWNDPRPRIAVAGDEVVVTDPNAGVVRRIATKDLSEIGTVKVEGKPYNIAVTGGSGVVH